MHLTTMDHMQQQQAKAWEVYQARMKEIQSLTTHGGISTAEGAKAESGAMAEYNSTMAGIGSAQQAKAYSEAKKTIEDDLFLYEQQLAGKRKLTADDEFTYRYDKMHALAKSEEITWDDLTQYLIEEDRRRVAASAQADAEMARAKKASLDEVVRQENQLHALEQKIDLDQFAGEARKQQAIKQTTQAQIEQFTKLAQALGMTQQEIDAWVAKIKSGAVIQSQAVNDGANHIKEWQQIAGEAEQQFAAGFASAFISFADGTKTAGQAFEQFAASFMEQVAQMILQMLILRAISGIFGGAAGGAGGAGGGGAVSGTMMAAGGGVFAPRMMADGGFAGMFSSPTYFPRFNVVGGEAGTEMLAALARPTFRSLGGIDAIVGNAGSSRLALTNADALGGRGGAGGMIHIRIEHTPETQATIVQNSIKGAVSQVTQELKRNSALSSAVKTLTQ